MQELENDLEKQKLISANLEQNLATTQSDYAKLHSENMQLRKENKLQEIVSSQR